MELTTHQHVVLASRPIELIVPWEEVVNIMADRLKLNEHEKINSVHATHNGLKIEVSRPGKYAGSLKSVVMLLARWLEI